MSTTPRKFHTRNRFRKMLAESLEERRVMATFGTNALAVVQGEIQPEGQYLKSFQLDPDDFVYVGKVPSVLLQFTAKPIHGQTLDLDPISIRNLDGSAVDVLYSSADTMTPGASVLIASVKPGNFEIALTGDNCSSGEFELVTSLVGDVEGDRDVDQADFNSLRRILNSRHGDDKYVLSADYDLNGRVTGFDNSLLVRNLGAVSNTLSALKITVNETITPVVPELPKVNPSDAHARTIARLRSATGEVSDFVDNELYIFTNDDHELSAFVERWHGTILASVNPSELGYPDLPGMYLIQIDPSQSIGHLEQLLQQIDPTLATGSFEVSSLRGKQLLTAATMEAQTFASRVGISWISQPSSTSLGLEDPSSRDIPDYTPDAATWPHMSSDSPQDIGVVDAWRMMRNDGIFRRLEAAGPLDEGKLELAVFDNGFVPNADWPNWMPFPNLGMPFGLPTPFPGKEWHGSMVIEGGAAVPWNRFGAAGPGGPAVNVWAVPTTYDPFFTIAGLLAVSFAGADLVNMSFHMPVPAILSWSVLPYDLVTATVRETGTLIFAAAGNESANIDEETDFIFTSVEDFWYTPAENSGVLAIGGLAYDSIGQASSSNYGRRDVDLFAPFFVYVGPSAPVDVSSARVVAGTSFSAPFAAGVAALIWASNPALSADQVEQTLLSNAKRSSGLAGRHGAYVDAAAAVHAVLGDTDPFVCITAPLDHSSFVQFNQNVPLTAEADDWESTPTVVWSSNLDGELGTGLRLSRNDLSIGTHTITATAYDSAGQSTSESITVIVTDIAPIVSILAPDSVATYSEGASVSFIAESFDNTPSRTLPDDSIRWSSSLQGILGTGHSIDVNNLVVGTHTITVQAVDASGLVATDTKEVTIVPATSVVPVIDIVGYVVEGFGILPTNGPLKFLSSSYDPIRRQFYIDLSLVAFASDAEDGLLEELVWRSNRTDIYGPSGLVSINPNGSLRLYTTSQTEGAIHLLTVSVTDSDGQVATDSIVVTVDVFI